MHFKSWLIWKNSLELNPLIQYSIHQDYLPDLYPIIPLNIYVKPWEENTHPTAKYLLISATRKIPLNKFTCSANKNLTPFPSNSNFPLITLYRLHLQLYCCCIIFVSTSGYINWMLSLAWQKHWMVKVLPSKIFILPNFQCYLKNPASPYACFPLFLTFFFISTGSTPVGISWLVS